MAKNTAPNSATTIIQYWTATQNRKRAMEQYSFTLLFFVSFGSTSFIVESSSESESSEIKLTGSKTLLRCTVGVTLVSISWIKILFFSLVGEASGVVCGSGSGVVVVSGWI